MRVKEVEVTANIAWSPEPVWPIYLAAGTAAQQLDASFSTLSALEVYDLQLASAGLTDVKKVASVPVENRFHKLVWSQVAPSAPSGSVGANQPIGLIVGGSDKGGITVFDATKLVNGRDGFTVFSKEKHTGPVAALDFNPFQHNLLASGASESEIFIWDMNKPQTPMTPGAKSQPAEDVRCVAWNKQVQHILATAFPSRCLVWDLRKNDPIIKVSDASSGVKCKAVAWHPRVATQMCIASEDDHAPVLQIWDLRLASSPLRVLQRHTRGVLGLAWCQQDPDLLMSCGKDNRVVCWNPNSNSAPGGGGEVLSELYNQDQWSFDVAWCPRNPAIVATASFDGKVSVHSIMGGKSEPVTATPSAIADSFPGMESMQLPSAMAQMAQNGHAHQNMQPKVPPRWMKRPCGASFGFGGKLVTFESSEPGMNGAGGPAGGAPAGSGDQQQLQGQGQQKKQSEVFISNLVTEEELVRKSARLETSLQNGNFAEFCQMKVEESRESPDDQEMWQFIGANFGQNPRHEFLGLLGYDPHQVAEEIVDVSGTLPANASRRNQDQQIDNDRDLDGLTDEVGGLIMKGSLDDDGLNDGSSFDKIAAKAEEEALHNRPVHICTDDSGPGLLSKALLTGNLPLAVELCLKEKRYADAMILATQGGPDLLQRTQKKYFEKCDAEGSNESPLIEAVVSGGWADLARRCNPKANWKETLVAALTYCAGGDGQAFRSICLDLALKLEGSGAMRAALICFICAADLDNVVRCWMSVRKSSSSAFKDQPGQTLALQDLVEVVMMLKYSVSAALGGAQASSELSRDGGPLSESLASYASVLAAQGALDAALGYLGDGNDEPTAALRDRLQGALGLKSAARSMHHQTVAAGKRSGARNSLDSRPRQQSYNGGGAHLMGAGSAGGPPGWNQSIMGHGSHHGGDPYTTAYTGIHNPAVEDLNTFNPPVPHLDQGGITNRRNSRPTNPSIDGYYPSSSSSSMPAPSAGFQGASYVAPPPPAQGAFQPGVSHQGSFGASNQQGLLPQPPPVNIFTPDYSQSAASVSALPPPMSGHTLGGAGSPPSLARKPPTSSGPGWNDPPPLNLVSKAKSTSGTTLVSSSVIQQPITQPLMLDPTLPPQQPDPTLLQQQYPAAVGPPPMALPPLQDPSGWPQSSNPMGYNGHGLGLSMQQPAHFMTPGPMAGSGFAPAVVGEPESMVPATRGGAGTAATEPPASKMPIPEEHLVLQEVFDGLRSKCVVAANHPQTKRKLEDVGRKLETLYDKLRENSLPEQTVSGLHQIKEYIWAYDYGSCLTVLNLLVSSGSFSVLSQFLPGVKVLIQVASQLGVYLERSAR